MKYTKTRDGRLKVSFTSDDLKRLGANQKLSGHFYIDRGGLLSFPKRIDFFEYSRSTDAALYELEKIAQREAPREFQFVPMKNPRPRIGAKNPRRVSSATGKRPSARLVSRRQANTRKGYFPNPGPGVRIVHNKLLGGWFIVRGPHQTPISGRFDSKEAAKQSLIDAQNRRNNPRRAVGTPAIIALARKHVGNGAAMESSARFALAEAVEAEGRGDIQAAKMWAVKSLAYSVGIFHADYKKAAGYDYKQNPAEIHVDINSHNQRGARNKNPVRPLAKRAGIRFYRKHGGKWLMFDPATYPAKTRAEAQRIANDLAQMFKTQIKVIIDK